MSRQAFPDYEPRRCSECGEYEDTETELRYVGTLPAVLICEHCADGDSSEMNGCDRCRSSVGCNSCNGVGR